MTAKQMRETSSTKNKYSSLSLEEYLKIYDPLSDENVGLYRPEDGAALRYSVIRIYQKEKCMGFSFEKGHVDLDFLKSHSLVKDFFERDLALQESKYGIVWCTYGEGKNQRDLSEREMLLLCSGGIDGEESAERQYTIRREDVTLSPVSPLTQRGMSLFFTKAAELAEAAGFEIKGIEDDHLQVYLNGEFVTEIAEDGSGSYTSNDLLKSDGSLQEISFSTPSKNSFGQFASDGLSAPSSEVGKLLTAIHQARVDIPEVLFPSDYALVKKAETTQEQEGSLPSEQSM